MNAGNIFEAFFLAKEKIVKEPDIFSDPEYMKILQSVKKYFDSFVWVSNPMDRLIYLYAGKGYNNNAVADFIGVNVNTYRSRVSRVSTKLSGLLFDGQRLIDACVYAPAEEIAKTRAYIDQLNNRLVIGKELSNYMLEKIHNITVDSVQEQPITEEDKFQALMLVAHFSEPAIESKLSEVKPEALAFIMDELFSSDSSEWSIYYKKMQDKVSHLAVPPQKVIDYCKSE